jgi:hypothetical protein
MNTHSASRSKVKQAAHWLPSGHTCFIQTSTRFNDFILPINNPFRLHQETIARAQWWNAYNDVKHNEILGQFSGNQLNVFTGLSALYVLKRAVSSAGSSIFTITNIPSIHGIKEFRKEFFFDT